MARLAVGGIVREIDVVVLDKDGTLIDFHTAWGGRLVRSIEGVCALLQAEGFGDRAANLTALRRAMGSDPITGALLPNSAFVSASIEGTCGIAVAALVALGLPAAQAERLVAEGMRPVFVAPPVPNELVGIGDVAGRLALLRSAGMRIAIATNDERAGTVAGLECLGLTRLIDIMVCADDAGLLSKPAPDGLLHICRALSVAPNRLAMVGDAVTDLRAGRAAGAGLNVGVTSGLAGRPVLAPHADVVVADIHALGVTGS